MAIVKLGLDEAPYLGGGVVSVDIGTLDRNAPMGAGELTVTFSSATLSAGSLALHIPATPTILRFSLAQSGRVLASLSIGSDRSMSKSGSFPFYSLKAGAKLTAGSSGGLIICRSFSASLPLETTLRRFFADFRLPGQGSTPELGESIEYHFDGYINVSADVSSGYVLTGTPSIRLGEIALAEKHGLAAIGSIGLSGQIAGNFAITLTRGALPGNWARVRVSRRDSDRRAIAADVRVQARAGLNVSQIAFDFLGAALGIHRESLLNLLAKLKSAQNLADVRKATDRLGQWMISRLIDGPLETLADPVSFARFQSKLDTILGPVQQNPALDLLLRAMDPAHLLEQLAQLKTVDQLKAAVSQPVGMFAARLVGRALASSADLKKATQEIQAVTTRFKDFEAQLARTFQHAASRSFEMSLHREYSRTQQNNGLIDVEIDLDHPRGAPLLRQAVLGEFTEVLSAGNRDAVRLQEAAFTHRIAKETAFKVNILGWHANAQYEGFDRVITECEQRLEMTDEGVLVHTAATLEVEKYRATKRSEMHMAFLLQALGESRRAVEAGRGDNEYLLETLESLSAGFQLAFTDKSTTELEFADALAFARDLGIAEADPHAVLPLMARDGASGLGEVEVSYDVRFGKAAVLALLSVGSLTPDCERALRDALRKMVLANYLRSDALHDVAFAFATPSSFDYWRKSGGAFTQVSQLEVPVGLPDLAIAAPASVRLAGPELRFLDTLYRIEAKVVEAVRGLYATLSSVKALPPQTFAKRMSRFGDALKAFDAFDQTSSKRHVGAATVFFVFDALVRLAGGKGATSSTIRIRATVNGETTEKVLGLTISE